MYKTLTALVLSLALGASSVWAKEFLLPEKRPLLSVEIPESWHPEETDRGVKAESEDEAIYLQIDSARSEAGMEAAIEATFTMLAEHNVEFDKGTKKTQKFKIAGQDAEEMIFTGKDKDGPAIISITMFTIKETLFIVTYWATTAKAAKHQPDVTKIVKSMTAVK